MEQTSVHHLIRGHGVISECLRYGIPYCLQTIEFILKSRVKCIGRFTFKIYVKTRISAQEFLHICVVFE
jgi:hypothetical protein